MNNYLKHLKLLVLEKKWLKQFLSGQGYCIICNHTNSLDLEYHHLAGKNNDKFTVSVCRNCHGRLSRKQRLWPKTWTRKNNSPDLKEYCFLQGLIDIMQLRQNRILWERHYGK